jgi:hypothetical protein
MDDWVAQTQSCRAQINYNQGVETGLFMHPFGRGSMWANWLEEWSEEE